MFLFLDHILQLQFLPKMAATKIRKFFPCVILQTSFPFPASVCMFVSYCTLFCLSLTLFVNYFTNMDSLSLIFLREGVVSIEKLSTCIQNCLEDTTSP